MTCLGSVCNLFGHDWKMGKIPGQYAPEYRGECQRCGKIRHTLTQYPFGGDV